MTTVALVPYGRAATAALADRIKTAQAGHPLDLVTVIVPSNTAGLVARRRLGGGSTGLSGLANVSFVTPFRLAELLGSADVGPRLPLTNTVLAAAVRAVLAADAGMLAEVADHQATQRALLSLYSELSRALPETLEQISAASARGNEVVRLVRAIRERLAGYYDEDDLAAVATQRLQDGSGAAASTLGSVVWYLPDRLSAAMTELVTEVLARTPSSAVVGLTGEPQADGAVRAVCAAAGLELPATEVAPSRADRLISASDPDEEVRAIVREVIAIAESGTSLDRVAVFYPAADPYARTLLEQLDAAGIPHNGPGRTRLADTVAGRTALAALDLPNRGWGRADVIAMIAGGPVRHADRLAPSGRWDDLSRRAGVVGGTADWRRKLDAHADRLRTQLDGLRAAPETSAHRNRAIEGEVDASGALADFVDELAAAVARVRDAATWAGASTAGQALLTHLLGPDHRRLSWPSEERDRADRVDEAIARLAVLDGLAPAPTPVAVDLAVAAELEPVAGRVGRFGEGVLVAPLASAVGLDLDAVFVVGMAEGTCPSFRRDDSLLPDDDRHLAVAAELVTRRDRLADQHRTLLAALSASSGARTLLFPRGDLRSRRQRRASRWLLDTATHLTGRRVFSSDVDTLDPSVLEVVGSYVAGVAGATTDGCLVDRDVRTLLAFEAGGGDPAAHTLAAGDLRRGYLCRRARSGAAFTEWDGNLAGQQIPSPATGLPLSPSRLETWATCPFKYFLGQVLRLGDRDDPEEIVEVGAADRGTLVHDILELFVGEAITRPGGPPAPNERWTDDDRARMREHAATAFARFELLGRTGRALTWRRTQDDVLSDLERFLDADDAYRAASGVRPVAVEMSFGLDGKPPLALSLPSGRRLLFRGKADRVDMSTAGRAIVTDYKTGSDNYGNKLDADPVLAGTSLQLGIYAEAARAELGVDDIEARYLMASTKAGFKAHGYLWDADRRQRFLDVAEAIIDGVESGKFPALPGSYDSFFGSHENCGFCDFNRVCPRDRDDHQQAKAGAPELALLDRLALPVTEEAT